MDAKPPQQRTPSQGELVIAQVTKITNFGAYCKLLEYDNLEVFLPIREVSSGWIKNIRMFIHEGQKMICRVTVFDREKRTIDISVKKVTQKEAKQKMGAYNLENRLEALVNQVIKGTKSEESRQQIEDQVFSEFGSYTNMAKAMIGNTEEFKRSKLPKNVKDPILKALEANLKKKDVSVSYLLTLSTTNTKNGASEMRKLFSEMEKSGTRITYIGAPKYKLYAIGKDYTEAEGKVSRAVEVLNSRTDKSYTFEIEKEKLKKEKEGIISQYITK